MLRVRDLLPGRRLPGRGPFHGRDPDLQKGHLRHEPHLALEQIPMLWDHRFRFFLSLDTNALMYGIKYAVTKGDREARGPAPNLILQTA